MTYEEIIQNFRTYMSHRDAEDTILYYNEDIIRIFDAIEDNRQEIVEAYFDIRFHEQDSNIFEFAKSEGPYLSFNLRDLKLITDSKFYTEDSISSKTINRKSAFRNEKLYKKIDGLLNYINNTISNIENLDE